MIAQYVCPSFVIFCISTDLAQAIFRHKHIRVLGHYHIRKFRSPDEKPLDDFWVSRMLIPLPASTHKAF